MENIRPEKIAESTTLILISREQLNEILQSQQIILQQLKELNTRESNGIPLKYITAKEFMSSVRIKRTKFDQLVQTSVIKTIKMGRKIYVHISEIDRYFSKPR
jgi:hypothetical protein